MARRNNRRRPAPQPSAAAIAQELVKAMGGPRPAMTPVNQAYLAQLQSGQPVRGSQFLPWNDPMVPFGPNTPIPPGFIDPPTPGHARPAPRRSEYPVGWNLAGSNNRLVPWSTLRSAADTVDVVRRCIEIRKHEIVGLDWDITFSDDAVAQVVAETGGSTAEAHATLLTKYGPEIQRLKAFWRRPDRLNGYTFEEWCMVALEEHFVVDALAIYPHLDMKGDLHSLEVIDGTTVKPLLDHRGSTPQPPNPAYQQILHGFPRGEFLASPEDQIDDEYASDALIYRPRYRRTWTPYGYSPTEQSLVTADLYLKRQEWLRAEYTAGVTPEMIVLTDAAMTPDQLHAYEAVFNDDLSGRAEDRHRARFLPNGMTPWMPSTSMEQRFNTVLDEHLVKMVGMVFDVMPTELGITPKSGLGGKGHQEGEEDTTFRKATRPTLNWLVSIFNDISIMYLGMPEELTFSFLGLDAEDEAQASQVLGAEVADGRRTLNDARDKMGLPRYDFEEADKPFVQGGTSGIVFIEGLAEQQQASAQASIDGANASAEAARAGVTPAAQAAQAQDGSREQNANGSGEQKPNTPESSSEDPKGGSNPMSKADKAAGDEAHAFFRYNKAAMDEARVFLRYASKRAGKGTMRPFTFEHFPEAAAIVANKAASDGNLEAAKAALVLTFATDQLAEL
jgi:hypothetical protein